MLAEQVSSIDVPLPQELTGVAHFLSGELAWAGPDALRVVHWLSAQGSAVVGVELCRDTAGAFSFLASSDYSPHPGDEIDAREVARCAEEAARFIMAYRHSPEDLFSLSWLPPVRDQLSASPAA